MYDITWPSLPQVTARGSGSRWGEGHGRGRVMGGGIQKGKAFSGDDAHFCPEVFSVKEGT